MRNYIKFILGLDYDPNQSGGPPNTAAIFANQAEAEGYTGQQYVLYIVMNKALVLALLSEIEPAVLEQMRQQAQDGIPASKSNLFEFNMRSPKEWWSNGK